ncbi:MAG: hypothetical protein ACP5N7_07055 [Candidatus Pacearchaeota archaeon]
MKSILKRAFVNAFCTLLYIILLVVFMFSLQRYSGVPENEIIIPISMLLLFVCSAAITGGLVFGKPVMLYIDGRKKEAVSLLLHTIGMLVLITIVFFVSLLCYMNRF